MRSPWRRSRGSSTSREFSSSRELFFNSSSDLAPSTSQKWSSGTLDYLQNAFSGYRRRTSATPRERFLRSHIICSQCGVMGHDSQDCQLEPPCDEQLKPNSPILKPVSPLRPQRDSVIIFSNRKQQPNVDPQSKFELLSHAPLPSCSESEGICSSNQSSRSFPRLRSMDHWASAGRVAGRRAKRRLGESQRSSLSSSPTIIMDIDNSISSQSHRESPYSSSSIYCGFPDSVNYLPPGVEFPDDEEEPQEIPLWASEEEEKLDSWQSHGENRSPSLSFNLSLCSTEEVEEQWENLEETCSFSLEGVERQQVEENSLSGVHSGSFNIPVPSANGRSLSDWSDFEKHGIDVDLFVGASPGVSLRGTNRPNSLASSGQTPINWATFTRACPPDPFKLPVDHLNRFKAQSAVLTPRRKWLSQGEDDEVFSHGSPTRRSKRAAAMASVLRRRAFKSFSGESEIAKKAEKEAETVLSTSVGETTTDSKGRKWSLPFPSSFWSSLRKACSRNFRKAPERSQ